MEVESVNGYRSDDPQHELYRYIRERVAGVAQQSNALNRCGKNDCTGLPIDAERAAVDRVMLAIARMQGNNLHVLPDVAFVRVTTENPGRDMAYTLIRNKAYKNVTSFLSNPPRCVHPNARVHTP